MKNCLLMLALAAWITSFAGTAHASTLVLYPFNNSSDGQSGFSYSTFDSAVLTSSTVSKGSGLGIFSVATDSWSGTTQLLNTSPGSAISAATAADAITNNWYFNIRLTPNTTMNINSIEADWSRGGTSGVRGWFVRSSQDSFATDLYSNQTPIGTATGLQHVSFDLSGFTGVGATDFRFYIYTPGTTRYVDFQNIQFNSSAPSTLYWLGSNGTLWSAGNNWSSNATGDPTENFASGADITFSATGSTNSTDTDLGGDQTIASLTINTTAPVGISGGNLTVSGATTINNGTLTIGNGSTTGALIGDITNNATLAFNRSDASTYSGEIDGTGNVNKLGNGTLTLVGNNTYTGGTTLAGGTLSLGSAFAIGTSGNISFSGGSLQFTAYNTTDYSARFSQDVNQAYAIDTSDEYITLSSALTSDGGSLTKQGAGTLVLTGTNTYTGNTSISSGTLVVSGLLADSSNVSVATGATYQVDETDTIGSIAGNGTINLNQRSLTAGGSNSTTTFSGVMLGEGSFTKAGTGTLTLSGNNTYNLGTTLAGGTLSLDSNEALGTEGTLRFSGGSLQFTANNTTDYSARFSQDVNQAYAIDANGQNISLASNLASVGGSLTKQGAGTLTLNGGINSYTGNTSIDSGTLLVSGLLADSSNVSVATGATYELGATDTIGSIAGNGTINIYSYNLTAGGADASTTFGGVLAGTGSFTKAGTGTLTLSGNNTYTGGTTLAGGTLSLGSNEAVGTEGTLSFSGGSLQFTANNTTDYSARFSQDVNQAYAIDTNGQNISLANVLTSDGGSLTKQGTGTLTLTGNNTYTGSTTIDAGALQIGNGSDSASISQSSIGYLGFDSGSNGTATVSTGGAWTTTGDLFVGYAGNGNLTVSGGTVSNVNGVVGAMAGDEENNIAGSNGSVTISGGNWTNSGSLTVGSGGTGSLTVSGGNVSNVNGAIGYESSATISGGNWTNSGNLYIAANANSTLTITGGLVTVAGTLTKMPAGKINLNAGGTLSIGAGGTTGELNTNGDFTYNGTLIFNRTTGYTYSGNLGGSGSLIKQGSNALILTGTNTYNGTTTISSGTLQIGNSALTGSISSSSNIINNAILDFKSSNNQTYGGQISGSGALNKRQGGTLILSGNNTYTGDTTIHAGTLQIGNGGTSGSLVSNVSGGPLVFNRSDSSTYGGVFSGSTLTKLGAGTLTLTGNNTYTGSTTISAGTLQIGDGGTSGSLISNIINNAALVFDRSDASTYSGAISGTGAVTKSGAGTLSLTGSNTYTGSTAISAGTLQIGSANALGSGGNITFGGGTLQFGSGITTDVSSRLKNSITAIQIDTDNNNITFASDVDATNTGGLTKLGSGNLTLTGNNTYTGDTTVKNGTLALPVGGSISSVGNMTIGSASGDNGTLSISGGNVSNAVGSIGNDAGSVGAVTVSSGNWTNSGQLYVGNGGTGNLTISGGTVSNQWTEVAAGGGSIGNILVNGGTWNSGDLFLGLSGNGTLNLAGGSINSGGASLGHYTSGVGLANVTSGTWTNSGDLTIGYDGTGSLNISGGNISNTTGYVALGFNSNGTVNVSGGTWTNSGDLTIGYDGTGSLTINGTGMVTNAIGNIGYGGGGSGMVNITGGTWANSSYLFIGALNGSRGSLTINSGNVTNADGYVGNGVSSNGTASVSGGTWTNSGELTIGGDGTGSLAISGGNVTNTSGNIGLNAGSTGTVNVSGGTWTNSSNLAVGVSGTGSLTINGTGTVIVGDTLSRGSNGTINLASGGTLQIGTGGATGTLATDLANNGTLLFDRESDSTYSDQISGTGAVIKNGNGQLVFTGNNSYAGGTSINQGTLQIGAGGTTGSITSNITNNAALFFNRSDDTTYAGSISGAGAVTKSGAGTLTLSGNNTYTGTTTIHAGILQIGAGGDSGSISDASTITNNANLAFNRSNSYTYGGLIQGGGSLNQLGAGTLTLTGNNTYIGTTTISLGTLQVGDGGTSGSLTSNIINNAALVFNRSDATTYAGSISGTGAVTKSGAGTLTLAGTNNHTGGTQLDGGVLEALHANALGNGALTLSSGTLAVGNAANPNLVLSVMTDLVWSSSNATISLAHGGNITISGNFSNGGNTGNRTLDFGTGQSLQLGNNTLVSFGATNFSASNFVATISGSNSLSGSFQIIGNSLVYNLQGANVSGNVIDNSGAVATPIWVDFTVNGNTGNGTVITAGGNNTIRDLAFTNNGNLAIQTGYSLTLSQGQVAVENGSSVVSGGALATPGNFNKTGAGELDVQSTLSVNGTASIDAGLLSVNGNLIANSVAVNSGAILGGSGTIFAPVTVSGTLAPGNSPGTLSMASLALTPTAVTDIEIESVTNFDRLVIGGAATVDGTLNVIPYNGNPLAYGQQYSFLTAGGGISGEFDTITAPVTFRGRFLNLGTTGILLIAPDSYTQAAVTPNQQKVAKALDSFIAATSGDRETVSIALDLQTDEQFPAAFDQIMPGFYESLANMAIEQAFNQTQMLNQRISSVRLGAAGFQAIGGISQPLVHDKNGKSAAEAKDASPIVESATATNWNAWALGTGMFSRSTNLGSLQNYNNDAGGFLVGADYRWSENFVTGLYGGYDYSYAEYNGGGSAKGNSFSFGTYASYEKDGYYADAVIGGGYTGFQTQRSIAFGTIDRTASADPNSGQFTAGLNLGKDFEVGKFTLGPIVGAQYTYAGIGSFTESGAESLDLSLGQQNANSLRSTLGGRIAYTWNLNQKIALIPEVRMFWQHEFLNNPRNINASLDGGSGPSFGYETTDPYRNSVFAGAGVTAQFGKNLSGSVFYNINFGSQTYQNNMVSAGLNFSF